MTEQDITPSLNLQEDEVDLIGLLKTVWNGRKTIIRTTLLFLIVGLFIAIFSQKKFSASSIIVPQVADGQSKLGGLSSIAAMAGFNLDMNSGAQLSPSIYPQIVQSIPFQKELMYTKINFDGIKHKISLYDYKTNSNYQKFDLIGLIRKYTLGLPTTFREALRKRASAPQSIENNEKEILWLTNDEKNLSELLSTSVYLNIDQKNGYMTLTAILPEALAAAQLGYAAIRILQEKIIEFKIEKAQSTLLFVEGRFNEKKRAFEQSQENLALFRDQNKNVSTAIAKTQEERLQGEFQIAQSVYNELAKRLEGSYIQVKEETPQFSIIEPISVPTESFTPKRKQIVIIWLILGFFAGIGFVFSKKYFITIKELWIKK